jgi:hypothetical protein
VDVDPLQEGTEKSSLEKPEKDLTNIHELRKVNDSFKLPLHWCVPGVALSV